MNEKPNQVLSKTLAIVNAPLCLVAVFGLFMWLYSLLSSKSIYDAIGIAFGIAIVSVGLWIEYQYYNAAFKEIELEKEKAIWRTSMVYNALAVIA